MPLKTDLLLQANDKLGIEGYLIKAIYEKLFTSILNTEKQKAFLLRSRTRQGSPLELLLQEALAGAVRQGKESRASKMDISVHRRHELTCRHLQFPHKN